MFVKSTSQTIFKFKPQALNLNLENLKNKMIFSSKGYFRTLAVIASSQISVLFTPQAKFLPCF